jgi:hypothetical protein
MPLAQLRTLAAHPFAALMPPMSAAQYAALEHDVERNGQRSTITLLDGQILDGRNRARALVTLNRDAVVADLPASVDPIAYVLSNNVARRQLTPSQSAMIAARLVTTRQGVAASDVDVSQADAAERLSVSARYVRDAQWLTEHDLPLSERVFAGEITLAAAMRQARPQPERAPREVLIDVHPVMAEPAPAPAPATEDALVLGIVAMEGVDPGEWVQTLPAGAHTRTLLIRLDDFARRAYDIAEESGLLAVPAPPVVSTPGHPRPGVPSARQRAALAADPSAIIAEPGAIAAARAAGERPR